MFTTVCGCVKASHIVITNVSYLAPYTHQHIHVLPIEINTHSLKTRRKQIHPLTSTGQSAFSVKVGTWKECIRSNVELTVQAGYNSKECGSAS